MYNKVVIPLDGSELGENILPYVAAFVRGRESQIHLVSVASTIGWTLWAGMGRRRSREERQRVEQELRAYLHSVATSLTSGVDGEVEVAVRFGRPTDEILAFASEVGADLIAMSTHGQSGFRRWVFGSVTDGLLRGARCPLLLVRPTPDIKQDAQRPIAYRRILVPLDGSEMAEQVLPSVRALIRPEETQIFLLSVLMTDLSDRTVALLTSYPPGLQLTTTAFHHAEVQLRGYLRSVAAMLRDRGASVHIDVRQGAPADQILDYAADIEADLIGMTTHGLSGPSRWVYGNVAGQVLRGAQNPVLLIRPAFEQGESTR